MPTNFPTPQQLHRFTHFVGAVIAALPQIFLIACLSLCAISLSYYLALLTLRLLDLRRLLSQNKVFLELTPLAFSDKYSRMNEQFFSNLHGYEAVLSYVDKLLAHKYVFTVEIVGTRTEGIRYIFCVPRSESESFKKDIASFGSEIRVKEVGDYVPGAQRAHSLLLEFKLKKRYYPLARHKEYTQGDPITYLLGAMTHLEPNELMAFQLVLSPTSARRARKIHARMLHNRERMDALGRPHHGASIGGAIVRGINSSLFAVTDAIGETYHGPSQQVQQSRSKTSDHYQQAALGIKPHRSMGSLEEALAREVSDKLEQQKFRTNIRALIVSDNPDSIRAKTHDIRKSFNVYTTSRQALLSRSNIPYRIRGAHRQFMFGHRLPGLFDRTSCLLSVSEVASIYHFPSSKVVQNGDVSTALSKSLPAPLSVKNNADAQSFDITLGQNHHLGETIDIGLTALERERHVFVIGGTGSGKTTLLKYAIAQDIQSGKGVAIIDPHGDMAQEMLSYVPEDRMEDVIYFNPDDLSYPIGLNVLELTPGLSGDDILREKDLVTESVVSMFRKIFSDDDTGGHRIEYVLRNAIQTALTIDNSTLFTVYNLLNDPAYRRSVLAGLENEDLINFWRNELGKAGEFQQVKMVAGITAKVGRFLFSASAKRVLEQPRSTINFDEILNGKILICNFSKGLIGEDTSELFGISILAKIQLATLRRARVKETERQPFYLYVDEFQNFATPSFVQMLSESRKYKLFLTMAEQSTSQQDDQKMVNIILANVGTVICFRSGNPADERLLLPLFSPYIQEGGIANLSPYEFYIRMAAVRAQGPLSGKTIVLDEPRSKVVAGKAIQSSRYRYATTYVTPTPKAVHSREVTNKNASIAIHSATSLSIKKNRINKGKKKHTTTNEPTTVAGRSFGESL